jgi:hypothetical protein
MYPQTIFPTPSVRGFSPRLASNLIYDAVGQWMACHLDPDTRVRGYQYNLASRADHLGLRDTRRRGVELHLALSSSNWFRNLEFYLTDVFFFFLAQWFEVCTYS